jgi:hypothetical protein
MTVQTRRVSFIEIVNTVGSLASITGVSLLWLKGDGPLSWENVLGVAMIVASCVGLASALAWLLLQGYRRFVAEASLLQKVAYIGLGVPLSLLGGGTSCAIGQQAVYLDQLELVLPTWVTPNPSLKLTRYGRRCKPGLSQSYYRLSPGLQHLPPRAA